MLPHPFLRPFDMFSQRAQGNGSAASRGSGGRRLSLVATTSSNQASPQSLERLAPTQPGRAEWNLAAAEEQNRRKRDSVRAALTLHDINPRSGAALAFRQITSFPAHLCGARPEGVSASEFIPPMTMLEEALFASASQVR